MSFQWIVAVRCLRDTETSSGTKVFDLLRCVFMCFTFHSNVFLNSLCVFFTLDVYLYRYSQQLRFIRLQCGATVLHISKRPNCSGWLDLTRIFPGQVKPQGGLCTLKLSRLNILFNSESLRVPQEELQSFASLERPAEPPLPADPLMCGKKSEFN